jgi:hypothetical protein
VGATHDAACNASYASAFHSRRRHPCRRQHALLDPDTQRIPESARLLSNEDRLLDELRAELTHSSPGLDSSALEAHGIRPEGDGTPRRELHLHRRAEERGSHSHPPGEIYFAFPWCVTATDCLGNPEDTNGSPARLRIQGGTGRLFTTPIHTDTNQGSGHMTFFPSLGGISLRRRTAGVRSRRWEVATRIRELGVPGTPSNI